MTFTEAAIEVLRRAGKPLHYKKITELAIEQNLLSHVGKTPEITMSSRLATMLKNDRGDAPIIKVKPGVFGLRDFGAEVLEQAASEPADESDDVSDQLEASAETPVEAAEPAARPSAAAPEGAPARSKAPSKPLPGSDVFPEEEDDDEPILGGPEKEEASAGDDARDADGRRRRRRRRRRGRPGEEGAEAGPEVAAEASPRPDRPDRPDRPERSDAPRERFDRDRDRGGDRDRNGDRHRHESRGGAGRDALRQLDWSREPGENDLVAKELADAAYAVLQSSDRQAASLPRLGDLLVRRGRLQGDPNVLAPTIAASIRADIARRETDHQRARFRFVDGRVSLVEWALPTDAVRAEQDVVRAAERQREQTRRVFLRRMQELPAAGLAELLASWLNAEGVVALRAVRRPNASPGEFHFAGTLRRSFEETRLAIVVKRDGREIGRELVVDTRGSLHHYGNATTAWLVTFGQVLSGAREEASAVGAAAVALIDGMALAAAMERLGIGLRTAQVALSTIDFDLLDWLRAGQQERERHGRDRDDRHRDARHQDARSPRGGEPVSQGTRSEQSAADDDFDVDFDDAPEPPTEAAANDAPDAPSSADVAAADPAPTVDELAPTTPTAEPTAEAMPDDASADQP